MAAKFRVWGAKDDVPIYNTQSNFKEEDMQLKTPYYDKVGRPVYDGDIVRLFIDPYDTGYPELCDVVVRGGDIEELGTYQKYSNLKIRCDFLENNEDKNVLKGEVIGSVKNEYFID